MNKIHYTRKYKIVLCPKCDKMQVTQTYFLCPACKKELKVTSSGLASFPLTILNSYHTKHEAEEVCKHLKQILKGDK